MTMIKTCIYFKTNHLERVKNLSLNEFNITRERQIERYDCTEMDIEGDPRKILEFMNNAGIIGVQITVLLYTTIVKVL